MAAQSGRENLWWWGDGQMDGKAQQRREADYCPNLARTCMEAQ